MDRSTLEPSSDGNPLLARIAKLFNKELAAANDYLRAENLVYQELQQGKRLHLTDTHRASLVQHGLQVKEHLDSLCSIVKPETILRWHRDMKRKKWDYSHRRKKTGRPRTPPDTEALILRLSRENTWGYDRIVGELKKLGHIVSDTTVGNILRRNGLPFSPHRKGLSWKQFIESHMETLYATDFFTEEVWTSSGLVTFYCLFFIHISTRRIYIAGHTPHPNCEWVSQQARNFSMHLESTSHSCTHVIHDRDASFSPLASVLCAEGIKIVKTPRRAPNANAFAERFVREARTTLDKLVLVGERSLHHALKSIEKHHNQQRPHQGIGNMIPDGYAYPEEPCLPENVESHPSLGGLLNHYTADRAA